jgi:hypothetical protein
MTENYSRSTKIKEKTSMHKRHKFLFSEIFRLRNSEDKNQSSQQITTSTKFWKKFQLTNLPETLVDVTAILLTSRLYKSCINLIVWSTRAVRLAINAPYGFTRVAIFAALTHATVSYMCNLSFLTRVTCLLTLAACLPWLKE